MTVWGNWPGLIWLAIMGVALVRYLRVLFASGTIDPAELRSARSAMLVPALVTAAALGAVVLATDVLPAIIPWLPLALGVSTLLGAVWALERGVRAIRATRAEADAGPDLRGSAS